MGIKRTQDSGRRDSLGREIKVSGHAGERATEGSVSGGEGVARGDFASADHRSGKVDFSAFLDDFDEASRRRMEGDRQNAPLRDQIKALEQQIRDSEDAVEMSNHGVVREHAQSCLDRVAQDGVTSALTDPEFIATYIAMGRSPYMFDATSSRIYDATSRLIEDHAGWCYDTESMYTVPTITVDKDTANDEIRAEADEIEEIILANIEASKMLRDQGIENDPVTEALYWRSANPRIRVSSRTEDLSLIVTENDDHETVYQVRDNVSGGIRAHDGEGDKTLAGALEEIRAIDADARRQAKR